MGRIAVLTLVLFSLTTMATAQEPRQVRLTPEPAEVHWESYNAGYIRSWSCEEPFLVYIGAEWCGPCKELLAEMRHESREEWGVCAFCYVDYDLQPELRKILFAKNAPSLPMVIAFEPSSEDAEKWTRWDISHPARTEGEKVVRTSILKRPFRETLRQWREGFRNRSKQGG